MVGYWKFGKPMTASPPFQMLMFRENIYNNHQSKRDSKYFKVSEF